MSTAHAPPPTHVADEPSGTHNHQYQLPHPYIPLTPIYHYYPQHPGSSSARHSDTYTKHNNTPNDLWHTRAPGEGGRSSGSTTLTGAPAQPISTQRMNDSISTSDDCHTPSYTLKTPPCTHTRASPLSPPRSMAPFNESTATRLHRGRARPPHRCHHLVHSHTSRTTAAPFLTPIGHHPPRTQRAKTRA